MNKLVSSVFAFAAVTLVLGACGKSETANNTPPLVIPKEMPKTKEVTPKIDPKGLPKIDPKNLPGIPKIF